MSYSDPDRRHYSFPSVNFATTTAQKIKGPKGKTGRLIAVHVSGTVLFTAVTTSGKVDVGVTGTISAYMSLTLGTLAAGAAIASDDGAATVTITTQELPADTDILVTFTAPTGGTPAGTGTVTVIVDWSL